MNKAFGIFLTVAVHALAGILALTIADAASSSDAGKDDKSKLDEEMMMINASLAKLKETESPLPQKERYEAPQTPVKPTPNAITDDPAAKNKPKKDEKKDEPEPDWEAQVGDLVANRKPNDRDLEAGAAAKSTEGSWDGYKKGWAEENTGHKYWRELAGDAYDAWAVPTLETGAWEVLGCVRIIPSGKIIDTKIWAPSQNSTFDRSVDLVLAKLEKERTGKPEHEVPEELLPEINVWRCMKFRKEAG